MMKTPQDMRAAIADMPTVIYTELCNGIRVLIDVRFRLLTFAS